MNCPHCRAAVPESALAVHDVFVALGMSEAEATGVLAYASVIVGPFRLESLTVRRTTDERLIVTFPAKPRSGDHRHYYVMPLDTGLKAQIEAAVIKEYIEARRRADRRV